MFLYQMGEVNNSYDYVTDVPVTSNVDAKYLFLHNATNKIGLCWPGTHGEPISGTLFLEQGSEAYDLVLSSGDAAKSVFQKEGEDFKTSVLPKI